ncbi:MAG: type IV pilus modification PilV family protein [Candidatus Scalindua sp.]
MKSKTNRASMYPPSKAELIQSSINNRQSTIVNIQSQSGFTLIEIGIAIFILAIGLISMLALFPIGVDSIKKVTQYSNAAVLSESAISELIANKDYILGTMTAGISYVHPDDDEGTSRPFEDSSDPPNIIFPQYSWQAILKSTSATDNNLIRAQIAIFRNFNPDQFGTGTADFANGSDTAYYTPPLPTGLTSKDYIREDNDDNSDKFWYRIDSIGTSTSTITLEGPFLGTGGAGLTFSTTDDIIDIYETMFSKR